ncbi:hypothetical protein SCLCIDRAFT_343333 [Scleroderma citrinum Foug A]|uniref:Uncharacterized protein n=1 Tax=Scleroderma citrinum Foug A TaxID=1036808 RepID=A0A0C2YYV2_9AGAM|nr:hypothetical protein SCLCIDRAFT_343333 [Scleroderma citrinum Foug A]
MLQCLCRLHSSIQLPSVSGVALDLRKPKGPIVGPEGTGCDGASWFALELPLRDTVTQEVQRKSPSRSAAGRPWAGVSRCTRLRGAATLLLPNVPMPPCDTSKLR